MKTLHVSIIALIFSIHLNAAPSLQTMIGQLLMVGFHGQDVSDIQPLLDDIAKDRVGGVLLLGRNISSSEQLIKLNKSLQKASKTPLLIAVDQEGGKVARLKASNGFEDFPSAYNVGSEMDLVEAKSIYSRMAHLLKGHGINYNLAPVVDIHTQNSPIIGSKQRAYSAYPASVSLYAQSFIDAFSEAGVLTSLKHFPGHGSAMVDSHLDITDVSLSWEFSELRPYFDLIQTKKAKSIMIGHVYLKRFDLEHPATLSKTIVNGILRQEMGYEGMVISDDMMMKGVSLEFDMAQRFILALNAGVDMLIVSEPNLDGISTIERFHHLILKALERGEIEKSTIKSAYDRVMALKKEIE